MLSRFLTSELFAFMLIFCRVGSVVMLLPGFGEAYVPMRVRLMFALIFSLLLVPVLRTLPPVPGDVFTLITLVVAEILIGLFLGGLCRILIGAIHMAGMIIALQSSLASALVQDVTQVQGQASALGNFMGMTTLVLFFVMDLHHMVLRGIADSYTLFIPGQFPMVEDFSNHSVQMMTSSFNAAIQISSPLIVVGLILYLGAGIMARLVPNIQVFFLLMAPQIFISFVVLMMSFSAMMLWYMDYFKESISKFIAPS